MKVVGVHCIIYKVMEQRDGDSTMGVLLQKRNHKARIYPSYWSCFGGSKEEGEGNAECIIREIKEETSITFYPHEFDKFMIEVPIFRGNKDLSMMFKSMYIEKVFPHLAMSEESLGYAWFNPEEINHILLRPEDRMAINEFLKRGI